MDSTNLKYFVSAAQSMNFSEVARTYFVSQPTISHQISLLERELGVQLFMRVGTRLQLTREGRFFFPIARKIVDQIHDASLDIARFKQGKMGKISIFVAETCRVEYQRCAKVFSKNNPGVLIDVMITSSPTQADTIVSGDYDICFIVDSLIKNSGKFDYKYTHRDKLCLVLPNTVQMPENVDSFDFLADIPFIGLSPTSSALLHQDTELVFQKREYVPNLISRYNRMDEVLLSVKAGLGFAILPYSIIDYNYPSNINSIQLDDGGYCVDYVAAWRKDNKNGAVESFVNVIKSLYEGLYA